MFGPTSFFISHNGGYFVIYSLPDGNTFVAELTGSYEVVGQSRFLGHQVSQSTSTLVCGTMYNLNLDHPVCALDHPVQQGFHPGGVA